MSQAKPRARRRHRAGVAAYPDLQTYFKRSGDTQVRLARAVKLSQGYISRVVRGIHTPRPDLALRIATYASVPLDSFARVYLLKRGAA